jgi:acyl-CoA dehydrogenase
VEHPFLASLAETVEGRFHELQEALLTLATEDSEYAQYHAKRLADLVFDVVSAGLLLTEAQTALDEGEAREALVAEFFIWSRFGDDEAYGITSGDRSAMTHFDAIARYGSVDPATLRSTEPAEADD